MLKWKLSTILIGSVVVYQIVLAVLYGGYPFYTSYPDEAWIISAGVYLVKNIPFSEFQFSLAAADKPILHPLFIGIDYALLGFPWFLYFIWIWNALTMGILIVSAYYVGKYFFDERTGLLMALLMGLNWHVAWYGQRVLNDVGMTAFVLLSVSLFGHFINYKKKTSLLTSGLAAALAFWTKEPAFYLLIPFFGLALLEYRVVIRQTPYLIMGFIAGFSPFAYISAIRYGNPLFPFIAKAKMFGHILFEFKFNFFVLTWLPFALGILVCIFLFVGLLVMLKERKFLFFAWTIYSLMFYLFFFAPVERDKLLVHIDFILLLTAGVGLAWFTEMCMKRFGRLGVLPATLTLLLTNLYGSPFFYSLGQKKFIIPIFIHERLSWDKYGVIAQLIQDAKSKQSDWWFAQLFYDSPGPNLTLIIITVAILAIFVTIYLILTRTNIQHKIRELLKDWIT